MAEKAILFLNLGSPNSCTNKDLKEYLNEFLMDERVIDIPFILRKILVQGIIVPLRAPKSAEKYKRIWTDKGSPLVHSTSEITKAIESKTGLSTCFSMRYGSPKTTSVFNKIIAENPDLQELIVFPLYPHYAMSSYESAVVQVSEIYEKKKFPFKLKIIPPFYNNPKYIEALVSTIEPFLKNSYDHILFSYHGIPERHVRKTDVTKNHCLTCENCCEINSDAHAFCYRHQIIETTKLVAEKLKLEKNSYSFSFQSRLGSDAWLKPYTAKLFKEFPKKGVKKLLVICPAFVSDCLETLEEIHIEGKEDFLKNGGELFDCVPCLNTDEKWLEAIIDILNL